MKTTAIKVSSFACEFVCTFPTEDAAQMFTGAMLAGEGDITVAEIAQTAFALGAAVQAISNVAAILPNIEAESFSDTIPTLRAAPLLSTLPAPWSPEEADALALDLASF